jgi:hypothetical protein
MTAGAKGGISSGEAMREDQERVPPPDASGRWRVGVWVKSVAVRSRAVESRLERERPHHATIEIGYRCVLRDAHIAGGVLGGGLAYRIYFWVLGMVLLFCGGLGFASSSGAGVESDAKDAGLGSAVAHTVTTAAQESGSARWWLLVTGVVLTVWFSFGVFRALRLVHAAAWQVLAPHPRNLPMALVAVLAIPAAVFALMGIAGAARTHSSFGVGLILTLLVTFGYAAVILYASMQLPSRDVPWTAFLPGAIGLAVGIEALHVFTVYFLANKLAHSSQLYGALGLASTALFYLFLIGRGVVWAAILNAVAWEVRHPRLEDEAPTDRPLIPDPTS